MIVEYIRYEIEEARRQFFEEDYCHAREILLKSPHCLAFDLANCVEDPTFYTLRIHWDPKRAISKVSATARSSRHSSRASSLTSQTSVRCVTTGPPAAWRACTQNSLMPEFL